MKVCTECRTPKLLDEFYIDRAKRDCHTVRCKTCLSKSQARYRKNNPEKAQKYHKEWYSIHKEESQKKSSAWKKANPEKRCEQVSRWRKANPEKVNKINKKWRTANPEKAKTYARKFMAKKLSTLQGRLAHKISNAIRISLHGNKAGRHWEGLVNYTLDDLKRHLEKQFKDGMSWENYGKDGWWIDHIIPISVFNFEKSEDDDFKRCWALSNLRPLWAVDNIRKSDKLDKHFQPRLIFKH